MRKNTIKEKMLRGESTLNGWASLGSSYGAEILGHSGVESVTVDMQHGLFSYAHALPMLQAISATPALPLVRVPWNDPATIMHMLDSGAYGVICPMINNRKEAEQFVAACRYAPAGNRSFGPARATLYGGADYAAHANEEILTFAMIETLEGIKNLDDILATPGLDGVYVGPYDLSLVLGAPLGSELSDQRVIDGIADILARAKAAKKLTGIFCISGDVASVRRKQGFNLVTVSNEAGLLTTAAMAAVATARAEPKTQTQATSVVY